MADSRWPRDGRTLENLGLYDPVCKDAEKQSTLKVDRARHWLSEGALPSETVRSLFKRYGVYEGEFDRSTKKVRKRPGRKAVTKTRLRKQAAKKALADAKDTRRVERKTAKLAAKKAAAAAAAEGGEE